MKVFAYLFCLCVLCYGVDAPVPFVQNASGNLNLKGPMGLMSTPARLSEPSVFAYCLEAGSVAEYACGGGGEFAIRNFRLAFFSAFHELDSLYSQSYSELDMSYSRLPVLAGLGYGLSMEWMPGGAQWSRHLIKTGGSFVGDNFFLSLLGHGWFSNFDYEFGWVVGGGVQVKDWGYAFVEWDGDNVVVGNSAKWKFVELKTAYSFPQFGVSVALSVSINTFSLEFLYGFASGKTGWIGVAAQKKIGKMTIL